MRKTVIVLLKPVIVLLTCPCGNEADSSGVCPECQEKF
jgi:hypothetical protein